jgi:DNA repair exonuclease SbcCD ATPase subunit
MACRSWVLLFALVALLAINCVVAVEVEADMEMETEGGPLARPLIDGVLSSPYKRGQLSTVADVIKTEPSVAKLEKKNDEDDWNGEEDGEDRFAYEKKLKTELRSLTALVKQSKEILKALPSKEARIETVKNKLEALRNEYAKEDAILKYKQQRALMKKIAKQELALKERVDALKNTETKLKGNIVKHQRTLRDVGVREAEMKILNM